MASAKRDSTYSGEFITRLGLRYHPCMSPLPNGRWNSRTPLPPMSGGYYPLAPFHLSSWSSCFPQFHHLVMDHAYNKSGWLPPIGCHGSSLIPNSSHSLHLPHLDEPQSGDSQPWSLGTNIAFICLVLKLHQEHPSARSKSPIPCSVVPAWEPPLSNALKINFDAAVCRSFPVSTVICRNSLGSVVRFSTRMSRFSELDLADFPLNWRVLFLLLSSSSKEILWWSSKFFWK